MINSSRKPLSITCEPHWLWGSQERASFSVGRGARLQIFKILQSEAVFFIQAGSGSALRTFGRLYRHPDAWSKKMTHIKEKRLRNVLFCSAGCSLLRAGGFSCCLDVSPFELSKSPLPFYPAGNRRLVYTVHCVHSRTCQQRDQDDILIRFVNMAEEGFTAEIQAG